MKIVQNGAGSADAAAISGVKVTNTQINARIKSQIEKQGSFSEVLSEKIEGQPLQFSKHASMRLSTREIALSNDQMKRVEDGVNKAGAKGIKDSLVFVDNVALVVNIRSKTVVTAMRAQAGPENDNVFTNIDGAVIV